MKIIIILSYFLATFCFHTLATDISSNICGTHQYFNTTTAQCANCHQTCKTCSNSTGCSTCANSQMFQTSQSGCVFCNSTSYMGSTQCNQCPLNQCLGQYCANPLGGCLLCPDPYYLDLSSLQCVQICPQTQIKTTISNHIYFQGASFRYCRGQTIYVDPDSLEYLELGTIQFPYKTSLLPLIELFNYQPVKTTQYTILIKEGSVDYLKTLLNQIYIINQLNLTISTYSPQNVNKTTKGQATIYIKSTVLYTKPLNTKFSIIENVIFDIDSAKQQQAVTSAELLQFSPSIFLVIRSNLTMQNLIILNDVIPQNTQFQLMIAFDIQYKFIVFDHVYINLMGKVFYTNTQLNFFMINTILQTDWCSDGIIILPVCDSRVAFSALYGDVTFQNFTLQGERYASLIRPFLTIKTINNITFDHLTITAFMRMSDANPYQIQTDSASTCVVPVNDGRIKLFKFTNIYMTQKTAEPDIGYSLGIFMYQTGDAKRAMVITYENITVEHLYCYNNLLTGYAKAITFEVNNVTFTNITQQHQYNFIIYTKNTGNITINNMRVFDCYTQSRILIIFTEAKVLTINNLICSNNTCISSNQYILITAQQQMYLKCIVDPGQSSVALFKHGTVDWNSVAIFKNFHIYNNNYNSNQAYQSGNAVRSITFENCTFENETMSSSTSYLALYLSHQITIKNVTFKNMTYSDTQMKDSYLIRFDQAVLQTGYIPDTIIQDVQVIQTQVNFFAFGGFQNNFTLPSELYTIQLINITVSDNHFSNTGSFFTFFYFKDFNNAKLSIINSTLANNSFGSSGDLILTRQNTLFPLIIKNTVFYNNTRAQIRLIAGDQIDSSFPQIIEIYNCTFKKNKPIVDGLFVVQTNSILKVYKSSFLDNFSQSRGSILLATFQSVTTYFIDCIFIKNAAYQGGVFFTHYDSHVEFDNCLISENFGLLGGIGMSEENGHFIIKNSNITGNIAFQSALIKSVDTIDQESIISNTLLKNNQIISYDTFMVSYSQKFDPAFVQYIASNQVKIKQRVLNGNLYQINLSKSKLSIIENSTIQDSCNFISTYLSTVYNTDSKYQNISISSKNDSLVSSTSSTLYVSGVQFQSISQNDKSSLKQIYNFEIYLNSSLSIQYSTFDNFQIPLIYLSNSNLQLKESIISNGNIQRSSNSIITVDSSSLNIVNTTILNIQSRASSVSVISIDRSQQIRITNLRALQFNSNFINLQKSVIFVKNSSFENPIGQYAANNGVLRNNRALYLQNSNGYIYQSNFTNLQASLDGGAIYSHEGVLYIIGSSFNYNQANRGGALSIIGDQYSNYFSNNVAKTQGGAIEYSKYPPSIIQPYQSQMTDLLSLNANNYAPYGSFIASYPASIKLISYDRLILASGGIYNGQIAVAIIDNELNVVTNDQDSQLKIIAQDDKSIVLGKLQIQVKNGIGTFTGLKFIGHPNTQKVGFKIYASTIDTEQILKNTNQTQNDEINSIIVYFDFRECLLGEIMLSNNECQNCKEGTFSLHSGVKQCESCPENAVCPGGSEVHVQPGYWRTFNQSTNIIKCYSTSTCLGGSSNSSIYDESSQFTTYPLCDKGHGGNLCQQCIKTRDGIQYTRTSTHGCGPCPSMALNVLKLVGVCIGILLLLGFMIYINLSNRQGGHLSIVSRIFTNYIQIIASIALLNLTWPKYLKKYLSSFEAVGEAVQTLISFDCFLIGSRFDQSDTSISYFRVILISIAPLIFFMIFATLFIAMRLIKNTNKVIFQRQLIVTLSVIIYILLPSIIKSSFSLFFCKELDTDEMWLVEDLQVRCWTKAHLKWSIAIGLPMITIWIIMLPSVVLVYLVKQRKKLDDEELFRRFKIVYQGLKNGHFYWEYVNLLRKTFIILVNVSLSVYSDMFKSLLALLVLILFFKLLEYVKPYKDPVLNVLEQRENLVQIITFFLSLFFINKEFSDQVQVLAFILIIITNIWFLVLWVYIVFAQFKKNKKILRIASLMRRLTLLPKIKGETDYSGAYDVDSLGISNYQRTANESQTIKKNEVGPALSLLVSPATIFQENKGIGKVNRNQTQKVRSQKNSTNGLLKKDNKGLQTNNKDKLKKIVHSNNLHNDQTSLKFGFFTDTKTRINMSQTIGGDGGNNKGDDHYIYDQRSFIKGINLFKEEIKGGDRAANDNGMDFYDQNQNSDITQQEEMPDYDKKSESDKNDVKLFKRLSSNHFGLINNNASDQYFRKNFMKSVLQKNREDSPKKSNKALFSFNDLQKDDCLFKTKFNGEEYKEDIKHENNDNSLKKPSPFLVKGKKQSSRQRINEMI